MIDQKKQMILNLIWFQNRWILFNFVICKLVWKDIDVSISFITNIELDFKKFEKKIRKKRNIKKMRIEKIEIEIVKTNILKMIITNR